MGLRAEIINLIRLQCIEQLHHLHRVGQIAIVQMQFHAIDVWITIEVVDATSVESRSATDDAMHLVTLGE